MWTIIIAILLAAGPAWRFFGRKWLRKRIRISNLKKALPNGAYLEDEETRQFELPLSQSRRIIPYAADCNPTERRIEVVNQIDFREAGVATGHAICFVDVSYQLYSGDQNIESFLFISASKWPDFIVEPAQPARSSLRMHSEHQPAISSAKHRLYLGSNGTISRRNAERILQSLDQLPRQVAIERIPAGLLINPQVNLDLPSLFRLIVIDSIWWFGHQQTFRLPADELSFWMNWAKQFSELMDQSISEPVAVGVAKDNAAMQVSSHNLDRKNPEINPNDPQLKGPNSNKLPYSIKEVLGLSLGLVVLVAGYFFSSFSVQIGGEWTAEWMGSWNMPFVYVSGFIAGCSSAVAGMMGSSFASSFASKFFHRQSNQWKRQVEKLLPDSDLVGLLAKIAGGGIAGVLTVHFVNISLSAQLISIGIPLVIFVMMLVSVQSRYS